MSDTLENDLPDFDNPPVVETVLSAQFERLTALRTVHLGLFWQPGRSEFPNVEEHPALAAIFEQAGEPVTQAVQLRFQPPETLPFPRLWLLNQRGSELMQIQNDRFMKNWRKADPNPEYPHKTPVRKPSFERACQIIQTYIAS